MRRFLGNFSLASYIIDEHIHTFIRAGVKITVIVQYAKEGCSMSRDMLKPLQDDTGHPKKTIPQLYDTSQTCKTIRGTLNDFHHYHRQIILTPPHVSHDPSARLPAGITCAK